MNKDEFKALGKEFREMIKDFTNTGDFNKANRDIGGTVNSALDMAFKEVENALASIKMGQYFQDKSTADDRYKDKKQSRKQKHDLNQTLNQDQYKYQYRNIQKAKRRNQVIPPNFPYREVGSASGIILTIFGSVLGGSMLIVLLEMLINNYVGAPNFIELSVLLFVSLVMTTRGIAIRKRLKRFRGYLRIINNRSTCLLNELSDNSGYSEKYIVKDLQRMIGNGMLPEARIDSGKSFVMLNSESHRLYLEHREELEKRENEQQQGTDDRKKGRTAEANAGDEDSIGRTAIEEAKMNIRRIREAKQSIADADVSAKVQRIEEITGLIIEYVEKHPKKMGEVRRLFAYYLPTTIKLVDAYLEFDRQTVQGENILKAKQEIKDALDTINHAFESLLDGLFENAALDVSADISVLRTILAQDGLTGNDFES